MDPHKPGGEQWQKVVEAERRAGPDAKVNLSRGAGNPRTKLAAAGLGAAVLLGYALFASKLRADPHAPRPVVGAFGQMPAPSADQTIDTTSSK